MDVLGLLEDGFEVEVAFGFFDRFEESHFGELLFGQNIGKGPELLRLRSGHALDEVIVVVGFWGVLGWGLGLSVGGTVVLEKAVVGSVGSFQFGGAIL